MNFTIVQGSPGKKDFDLQEKEKAFNALLQTTQQQWQIAADFYQEQAAYLYFLQSPIEWSALQTDHRKRKKELVTSSGKLESCQETVSSLIQVLSLKPKLFAKYLGRVQALAIRFKRLMRVYKTLIDHYQSVPLSTGIIQFKKIAQGKSQGKVQRQEEIEALFQEMPKQLQSLQDKPLVLKIKKLQIVTLEISLSALKRGKLYDEIDQYLDSISEKILTDEFNALSSHFFELEDLIEVQTLREDLSFEYLLSKLQWAVDKVLKTVQGEPDPFDTIVQKLTSLAKKAQYLDEALERFLENFWASPLQPQESLGKQEAEYAGKSHLLLFTLESIRTELHKTTHEYLYLGLCHVDRLISFINEDIASKRDDLVQLADPQWRPLIIAEQKLLACLEDSISSPDLQKAYRRSEDLFYILSTIQNTNPKNVREDSLSRAFPALSEVGLREGRGLLAFSSNLKKEAVWETILSQKSLECSASENEGGLPTIVKIYLLHDIIHALFYPEEFAKNRSYLDPVLFNLCQLPCYREHFSHSLDQKTFELAVTCYLEKRELFSRRSGSALSRILCNIARVSSNPDAFDAIFQYGEAALLIEQYKDAEDLDPRFKMQLEWAEKELKAIQEKTKFPPFLPDGEFVKFTLDTVLTRKDRQLIYPSFLFTTLAHTFWSPEHKRNLSIQALYNHFANFADKIAVTEQMKACKYLLFCYAFDRNLAVADIEGAELLAYELTIRNQMLEEYMGDPKIKAGIKARYADKNQWVNCELLAWVLVEEESKAQDLVSEEDRQYSFGNLILKSLEVVGYQQWTSVLRIYNGFFENRDDRSPEEMEQERRTAFQELQNFKHPKIQELVAALVEKLTPEQPIPTETPVIEFPRGKSPQRTREGTQIKTREGKQIRETLLRKRADSVSSAGRDDSATGRDDSATGRDDSAQTKKLRTRELHSDTI